MDVDMAQKVQKRGKDVRQWSIIAMDPTYTVAP